MVSWRKFKFLACVGNSPSSLVGTAWYAAASTAIHSIKWVKRILKGEIDPKNLFELMKTSFDMLPENPMALEPFAKQKRQAKRAASKEGKGLLGIRKRGIRFGIIARMRWRKQFRKEVPLYKRIWLAFNYFTLLQYLLKISRSS